MAFFTMKAIKEANKAAGQHFFDRKTMQFFHSKIATRRPIAGRYFVTSELFDSTSPRLYTIREVLDNGRVKRVGEFQGYASLYLARCRIKEIVALGDSL